MSTAVPSVPVFDVNETLIDIDSMAPLFERIFGDGRVVREWFGHLVMYPMTATLVTLTNSPPVPGRQSRRAVKVHDGGGTRVGHDRCATSDSAVP